jgi:PIN domain nuclease of toxin-antitoxin system
MAGGLPMILLDTCGLLALQDGGQALSESSRIQLEAPGSRVFISAISAFEIGQKHASGKLILLKPPAIWFPAMVRQHHLEELPVTSSIALTATSLPPLHKDPFDRLIIATALEHRLQILTSDAILPTYPGITTLW